LDRPKVLGIVNVTADSFSDGGRFLDPAQAIAQGLRLRDEGADFVDVGGESTRPGSEPVALAEELRRVIPVVEALASRGVAVSIDTTKPAVMRAAIDAGCAAVNDVNAFRASGAIEAVAGTPAGLIVMHMQGTPATMQKAPHYDDVVAEVGAFLAARAHALEVAGVASHRIALDPGFGFGKTVEFSEWGHGASDGPRGRDLTTGPDSLDKKQMTLKGWAKIDFNFDPKHSIAAFYGCKELDFAKRFIDKQPDLQYSAGFDVSSFPSWRADKSDWHWLSHYDSDVDDTLKAAREKHKSPAVYFVGRDWLRRRRDDLGRRVSTGGRKRIQPRRSPTAVSVAWW
jgi:dihydropteroate synthase